MKLFFWRKKLPLVSIITPVFNAEDTLERAINSVLQQSYKNLELILVDGLSEDRTPEIIRSAAGKDPRIRFISEKDHGAYDAMNKGLEMARGDWVYFLGGDDVMIHDHILQELYNEGCFSQEKVFYGSVIIEGKTAWAKDQEVYAGEFDLPKFLKKNICHQAIFYPRHIIQSAGFFNKDYIVCADWDYNMRCYSIEPFLYVDKIIARFSGGGLSTVKKETVFGKEFPGNIIRYFKLDPDDPELLKPGSPFRSVVRTYNMIRKEQALPLILVTGIPKTGSTALFHSIKNALPVNSLCLFEPDINTVRLPEKITEPILVKCFMDSARAYDHFNKKILLIRDPRDQVISQMLYRPFNIIVKKMVTPDVKLKALLEQVLSLLYQKEKDPASVSVREIRNLLKLESADMPQNKLIEYYQNHQDIFIFKYEDYVDGNLNELNKYLGLMLEQVDDVPQKRIIRSKSYGNWKDWFTPSDVNYYKSLFSPYMKSFGYNDNWNLNKKQLIDPAQGSLYLEKLIAETKIKL